MTGFDMTESIAPRSDQLNAEDMLTGPRTVTITEVRRGSAEQPVEVVTAEFGPGRPFKPSKTVRRIMVSAWGPDAATYAGKRMTLFRDPAVKFGGMDVGGIRVSHMSHLKKPLTLVLAVSKGKRAPYVIQPLPDAPAAPAGVSETQLRELGAALRDAQITDRDAGLAYLAQTIGREVASSKELTAAEAAQVIAALKATPAEATGNQPLPGTEQ